MRIPYGFVLISGGTLRVNEYEANIVSMIFEFYMAGASLGKVVDMLYSKQILTERLPKIHPSGKSTITVRLQKFQILLKNLKLHHDFQLRHPRN